jgi:hypothetical protein
MQKETRYRELIAQQQGSGLTIKEFCSNHGLAPATFHYWKKKLVNKSSRKDFIPLLVKPSGLVTAKGPVCTEMNPGKEVLLELVYPNGTILRVKNDLDMVKLRALIHLYD